jgi:protein-disulfide isomerase
MKQGARRQASGTPSFVVGGQLIPGFVEKARRAEVAAAARVAE